MFEIWIYSKKTQNMTLILLEGNKKVKTEKIDKEKK